MLGYKIGLNGPIFDPSPVKRVKKGEKTTPIRLSSILVTHLRMYLPSRVRMKNGFRCLYSWRLGVHYM